MKRLLFSKKRIIIIRVDAIGDYILFRNFLPYLKTSACFKDYHLTLCGNVAWKQLAEQYDSEAADQFIWLDRNRLSNSRWYRWKFFLKLKAVQYDIAICPTFSRKFFFEDDLIRKTRAKRKIGNAGDRSNMTLDQKQAGDSFYDELIETDHATYFEFWKNKEFFEKLLNTTIDLSRPTLIAKKTAREKPYIILFLGASDAQKRWHYSRFSAVAAKILEFCQADILLCGSHSDSLDAAMIIQFTSSTRIIDFTGKTTLTELAELIAGAELLISNDTSAVHIGTAVNTSTICIYKGDHFGRFQPCPREVAEKTVTVLSPEMEKQLLENPETLFERSSLVSNIDINTIEVERVWAEVQKNYFRYWNR